MRLLKRKRKAAWNGRLTGKLEQVLATKQRQLADELNRRTQHWNKASKMILLMLFCLLFGSISLWLLIHAMY